jgi:serine phosphatase RsbU (regulator of sigma subunit)/putative methionine-R-sulfoxide reductase with GAF domain
MLEASLDPPSIFALLHGFCHDVVQAPLCALILRDEQTDRLTLVTAHGVAQSGESHRRMYNYLKTSGTLTVSDWVNALPLFEPIYRAQQARSGVYVPIVAENEMLGVLAVESPRRRAFAMNDRRSLELAAVQTALALHTDRLYHRERERSAHLLTIAEVSRKVAAILDLHTLFQDTVHLIQETFGYYHVCIFTVDAAARQVALQASTSPLITQRGLDIHWGRGIIGGSAALAQSLRVNDVREDQRFVSDSALEPTRAELAIPIKVEERILGVLDLQSDRVGAFTDRDVSTLQILADQIAVAIEDSRLYATQQQQAWTSTALLQISQALAQQGSEEEILATASELTHLLVGMDRAMFLLWAEDGKRLRLAGSRGLSPERAEILAAEMLDPETIPLLREALAQRQPVPGRGDDLYAHLPPPLAQLSPSGALLALPLRDKQGLMGLLIVEETQGQPLNEVRTRIITGLAEETARALETTRLYASLRQEAWVSTALLQVANVVGSATYDLQETLATMARLTTLLMGVPWCAMLLWDEARQCFDLSPAEPASHAVRHQFAAERLAPAEAPLLGRLLSENEPIAVRTASDDRVVPTLLTTWSGPLTALALRAHDRLLGALLAGHPPGVNTFTGHLLSIMLGVANQSALAIDSAQLYARAVRQERLQHEMELARKIQESFLPKPTIEIPGWEMAVEWRAARGVGGDYYDFVPLDPTHLGILIADVSDKGVAAALYMALSRTVMRAAATNGRGPAETLRQANRLLLADSQSGMFVSMFYGVLDLETGLLTYARAGHNPPILVQGPHRTLHSLAPAGIVLGVVDDPDLAEESATLSSGDMLVMYTDGVTEAINERDEEFGEECLRAILSDGEIRSASDMIASINAAVDAFAGDSPQFDDFTLVTIRRSAGEG